jgi:hypothetical protein
MNELQIKNILTPIIGIAVSWLATKFPLLDQATWNTLVTTFVFAIVTVVLAFFNRTTSVLDVAGKQPGTTVVTTPQMAAALPENPDVIPATPQIVAAVKAAPGN